MLNLELFLIFLFRTSVIICRCLTHRLLVLSMSVRPDRRLSASFMNAETFPLHLNLIQKATELHGRFVLGFVARALTITSSQTTYILHNPAILSIVVKMTANFLIGKMFKPRLFSIGAFPYFLGRNRKVGLPPLPATFL